MDFNTSKIDDLRQIKKDLLRGIFECSSRGLYQSEKWLAEMSNAIKHVKLSPEEIPKMENDCGDELEEYLLGKSYFNVKEYNRCAHFLKDCKKPQPRFLYFYSRFLSVEKLKLDNMTDINSPTDQTKNESLRDLRAVIMEDYVEKKLDGFCLYLCGVISKKLNLLSQAIDIFVESINEEPLLWGSWLELALLVPSRDKLNKLKLPDHWIKLFFLAHTHLEQLNNDEALQMYSDLHTGGFQKSTYVMAQTAIVYHNRRNLEKAIETFKELLTLDPYRLDNLDTYSNLLYVMEMKNELADLAHRAVTIDKYKVETCCVIGNYYSLRSDHAKAVLYFQRALKLNPNYLSAWTLMGHEYMEMKNTNAAIQSYRQAIANNRRDYRAWYGLGQTYEILKMYTYSLYYYKQSLQLRPNDSRMIIAVGDTYEKLDKIQHALKCYNKACHVGDVEGIALLKLAKSYDRLNLEDNAAMAYTEYCLKEEGQKLASAEDAIEFYNAFLYLANYHLKKGQLDDAYPYAYKCLENEETKEHANALLKSIAAKRGEREQNINNIEETHNPCNMTDSVNDSNMDLTFSPKE